MPNLIPVDHRSHALRQTTPSWRAYRALARLEDQTVVRVATVQSEGLVQAEKLHEIDHLTRDAMTGQVMLRNWADTLAHGDPFVADDLKFFLDTARLGKGEVIANLIDSYCRESRS